MTGDATRQFDNLDPSLTRCAPPRLPLDGRARRRHHPVTLLERDWTVARIDGRVVALPDACPHRGSPLSAGCVVDGTVRCAYHGFRFDGQGRCVLIPHRWVVEDDGPVRLFRVVSRPVAV